MCGRYVLSASPEEMQRVFQLHDLPVMQSRFNIAPTQPVVMITSDAVHELTFALWGLVPGWSKEPASGARMINARSETAAEKPSFRSPWKYRRCLIPVSGFYEWKTVDHVKQPHYIYLKHEPLFAFAGLWDVWRSAEGDELVTCTILTTDANPVMKTLHDRMPVILPAAAHDLWLDKRADLNALHALMRPYPQEDMTYHSVSRAVNLPANDSADLILPDVPPRQQTLF
jgi:putative SOS response-associated peptidase YedK